MLVNALLAEYNSLRHESITAISYRLQIITFTFGFLAVIIGGLVSGKVPNLLTGLITLFVIPQISKAALMMWLGEYQRSSRAGRHLRVVEKHANKLLNHEIFTWETHLAKRKKHMNYPYIATAIFILGIGYLSTFIGSYYLYISMKSAPFPLIGLLITYIAIVEITFIAFFVYQWVKFHEDANNG
jgi:hypothetical protein